MCYNPRQLLCKKVLYKGVEKSIILWNTTFEEFSQGFAVVEDLSRLGYRTIQQLVKYGVNKHPVFFDCRLELPCRKCLECTRSRAREWSLRCSLESENWEHNYFVTLTYNNENVPRNYCYVYDSSSGYYVQNSVLTLSKTDTFSFMKHLRTSMKRDFNHDGIRFFMCGEYGTKFQRPHYHYCFFNLPLNDLVLSGFSKTGQPMYRSAYLERHWKKGFVTVQKFTVETARYCAQYCCKKLDKKGAALAGKEMEFINMSRRPGIGSQWFFKNMDSLMTVSAAGSDGFAVSSDIFRSECDKNGQFKTVRYGLPNAFKRYFKPFSDNKRGIDTEYRDLAFVLNKHNEFMKDVLIFDCMQRSVRAEDLLATKMSEFGFCYATDRYTEKYLSYLDIQKKRAEALFKVKREQLE